MLIGIFSDAHGVVGAYDQASEMLAILGAERLFYLGDALGYTAETAIVDRLMSRPEITALAGNHEAMLLAGVEQLPHDRASIYQFPRIDAGLTPAQRMWLTSLPREHFEKFNGVRLRFIHGSPLEPTFGYVYPNTPLSIADAEGIDAVFMGNTHRPFVRNVEGKQFINVGSCGLSRDGDPRGCVCLFDTVTRQARLIRFSIASASLAALADQALHPSVRRYLELQAAYIPSHTMTNPTAMSMPNDLNQSRMPVLVTGIGGGGHGEQILKALKLSSHNYYIVGADANAACANRHAVDHFDVLPPARAPEYLDRLLGLARHHHCKAIFHGSEPEMMLFSEHRARLESEGFYVPVNLPEVMSICQDKARTTQFLAEHGIRTPLYKEITALADCDDFNTFPAVIKPSIGGGGSANVFIAQDADELAFFAAYLLRNHGKFVVQEYIGTPDDEYTVGVLFGADGVLLNSIVIKRIINNTLTTRVSIPNRSGKAELGPRLVISSGISQGQVGDWPEIRFQCEKIASLLKPRAPINIQCRVVDGVVVPFEINPRFSGTTSLRALAGYNEPDVLIRRDVLGETIEPRFAYRNSLILRSLQENVVAGS